jgi:hypothetical protein
MTYRSSSAERGAIMPVLWEQPELQYVLEVSVRRLGQRVRISVRLVRVNDGTAIWTESFDRDIGDVLGLQAEVAQRIGRELQVKVNSPIKTEPVPSELETYFRGRFELQRHAVPIPDAARVDFERAIALSASYAPPMRVWLISIAHARW